MQVHKLKTEADYIVSLASGEKTFEVRVNDRPYKEGDVLHLCAYDTQTKAWGSPELLCLVTYTLTSEIFDGVKDGWIVMGIKLLHKENC